MATRKLAIAVTCLALGIAGAATLSADTPTNPNILQAIQAVQLTVNALATTDGSITTTLATLVTTVNHIDTTTSSTATTVGSLTTTIGSLVTTVNSLATTVNQINASVTEGKTRSTGELRAFGPGTVVCTATNVSAQTHSITVAMFNSSNGQQLIASTNAIAPNTTPSVAVGLNDGDIVHLHCKITVNDGVKDDVRGSLAVRPLDGSDQIAFVAQ